MDLLLIISNEQVLSSGVSLAQVEGQKSKKRALRRNLTEWPFYAAFRKTTNSVFCTAMRWAFSSR